MKRRNTIQRNLVLEAIRTMKSHVTAEEVFEFIRKNHPHIGRNYLPESGDFGGGRRDSPSGNPGRPGSI